ncbi:MAG: sarcosine oxidase subunit gamma [Alphaproteobacteria bacterium]|nr:sarcosine oxidase subunit gamma [Alphaproteobacteria bacterium]
MPASAPEAVSVPEPVSALRQVAKPGRFGAAGATPLVIMERRLSLVQILARKGREADVQAAIRNTFGLDLPAPLRAASSGGTTAIWVQPGMWMLSAPGHAEGAMARLVKEATGDAASIVDQSHGKTVLTLSGARARDVMAKGCRLDLHPRAFAPGHSAVTQVAHVGCMLRQIDEVPSYEMLVPSSFAETFFGWLTHSAAEYGYEVKPRA